MLRQTSVASDVPMLRQASVASDVPHPYPYPPAAKSLPDKDDSRDFFEKAGIELPSYLSTYRRRWTVLLVVALSGAFAKGPFAMWATLEPILISEGVWAGPDQQANLTAVYSIATGVSMVSFLLAGMFYDAVGARSVGAWGAFATSIALVIMALSIKLPTWNNVLWVAYPAVNVFGWANSYDVYAWLWLLPEDQNTVAAVVGAIQCLGDAFCLLAVLLNNVFGISLPLYFTFVAFVAVLAGFLALWLIPSQSDMERISKAVIQYTATKEVRETTVVLGQNYGATDENNTEPAKASKVAPETPSCIDVLRKTGTSLWGTFVVFWRIHPEACFLFLLYNIAMYMFTVYPMFEMYPLYVDLVGTVKATRLVDIFGGTYACIGALSLVLFGKLVDKIGYVQAIGFLNIPMVVNAVLYAIPKMPAQIIAQVMLSWIANVWYVVLPRFCSIYAPPELFGTMYGMYAMLLGVFQIFLTRFGTWACGLLMLFIFHGHPPPGASYLMTIDLWCFLTVFTSLFLLLWWWYYPLPEVASTTMAHVEKEGETDHASGSALLTADIGRVDWKRSGVTKGATKASPGLCCGCLQIFGTRPDRDDVSGMP